MPSAFTYGMTPANSPKGSAFQAVQPAVLPCGVIEMFAGAIAPNGWLICDGSTVSRRIYSDLFKIIGTTYGAGDSNTTFNLPDMRGRIPMGAGIGAGLNSSGTGTPSGNALTARTLGQWLGEETHLLTTAELASHTHANTVSGGNTGTMNSNTSHTHSATKPIYVYDPNVSSAGLTSGNYVRGTDSAGINPVTATNTDHTHTFTPSISNASAGSDSRHATIPPILIVNYIIKT